MTRTPRLAIGMPVHNGEGHLRQALDCHLAQTFEDFQIIIGDNASTDATPEICLEYARRDRRIVYHRHPENIGAAGNFNAVFRLSSAELFRWSADDDIMLPEYLARCIERLDADRSLSHCHCLTGEIDADGNRLGNQEELLTLVDSRPSRRLAASFRLIYPGSVWAVMRSECVARTALHGGYLGSDWNFIGEMLLQGGFGLVPEYLFFVRNHKGAFSFVGNQSTSKTARLRWFAPHARLPAFLSPACSIYWLLVAVMKHPLPAGERVACLGHIAARTGRKAARVLHISGAPLLIGGTLLLRAPTR
jgi:glycosyltransferase involved in cell wall biosynthesis